MTSSACCAVVSGRPFTAFTRSPIDSMPSTRPPLVTGRCRIRRWVMICMQSSSDSDGGTVTTGELMICHTGVSLEERPSSTTLRA